MLRQRQQRSSGGNRKDSEAQCWWVGGYLGRSCDSGGGGRGVVGRLAGLGWAGLQSPVDCVVRGSALCCCVVCCLWQLRGEAQSKVTW